MKRWLADWWRRIGLHGDMQVRYLHWGVKHCPGFLEPLFVWCYTTLFFLLFGPPRRAVLANLSVIRPDWGRLRRCRATWEVFWNFAWIQVDTFHMQLKEDVLSWEIDGREVADSLAASGAGALLLTAHMGSYDLAASLFSSKLGKKLNAVRAPERVEQAQEYMGRQREAQETDSYQVIYNRASGMVGVELAEAIHRGELVAIQGDRVILHVAEATVPWSDSVEWRLPKGPLVLARISRAMVYPVFIWRSGHRRYRIEIHEPFDARPTSRDHEAEIARLATAWAALLREVIIRHVNQWFVFEPSFRPASQTKPREKATP
jgi:lauroyl/myristoyl acyltransferase